MRPAVFLDRDGTMIEDVGYLDAIARVAFYPWTIDAVRALNRAELAVVVVTNQSGIARGYYSEADYERVRDRLTSVAQRVTNQSPTAGTKQTGASRRIRA